jgi:hypothetical protein
VRLPNTRVAIAGASDSSEGKRPGTMGIPQPNAVKKYIVDSDDDEVELYGFSFSHFLTSSSDMGRRWGLILRN